MSVVRANDTSQLKVNIPAEWTIGIANGDIKEIFRIKEINYSFFRLYQRVSKKRRNASIVLAALKLIF